MPAPDAARSQFPSSNELTLDAMLTTGEALVRELKHRRMLGSFLSFRDYRRLRELDSIDEVREFLRSRGFPVGTELSTVEAIAEFLRGHEVRENNRSVIKHLAWQLLYDIFLR